jgi:hypothetical protein
MRFARERRAGGGRPPADPGARRDTGHPARTHDHAGEEKR